MFSLTTIRRRLLARTGTSAFVLLLSCAAVVAATSRSVAQKVQSNSTVGADQTTSIEILTPTEGVDFNGYVTRLVKSVKHNWYALMPDAAHDGEKGKVSVRFHIQQNGTILTEEPKLIGPQ